MIPVISGVKQKNPQAIVSVDTYKAGVARAAVKAGAEIVNDVSGFLWDPQMRKTLAELKCGAVLMHMRGRPQEWKTLPPLSDVVTVVKRELRERSDAAVIAGMKRERIVIDPGFGFGKNREENYPLLRRFEEFHELRFPLLVGFRENLLLAAPWRTTERTHGHRPAFRNSGRGNRGHHEGRPHHPHSRCAGVRGRGADCGPGELGG